MVGNPEADTPAADADSPSGIAAVAGIRQRNVLVRARKRSLGMVGAVVLARFVLVWAWRGVVGVLGRRGVVVGGVGVVVGGVVEVVEGRVGHEEELVRVEVEAE